MMLDERLINDVRRHHSPLLRRIEPVLHEQLQRAKTIIESRRKQVERLWMDLIDRGSLAGHEIEEVL
jgi:ATP-dependent Zn protease